MRRRPAIPPPLPPRRDSPRLFPAPDPNAFPATLISARILQALAEGAHTPPALAMRLNVKELAVGEQLRCLAHLGHVTADPLGERGLRGQLWRLAEHG
jgi:hypothetical protein